MLWLILLALLILLGTKLLRRNQNYFKDRGIPYLKSTPLLGILDHFILGRKNFFETAYDLYNDPQFKDYPYYGVFNLHNPAIFVRDLKLIKRILNSDANYFIDRPLVMNENDPMKLNVAFVRDNQWKRIRSGLSRIFSSAKLKNAFPLIDEIAKLLLAHINKKLENGRCTVNLKSIASLYAIDVTANCFFGFNPKSLEGNFDELHEAIYATMEFSFQRFLDVFASFLMPWLCKIFKIRFFGEKYTTFVLNLMKKVFEERERSGVKRNDYVDLLLELKRNKELTEEEVLPQAGVFFFGGFDVTSTMLSLILYELSKHQDVQRKLRGEIQNYLKTNDKISYEAAGLISCLPYLDQVVEETLRLHLTTPRIDRVCLKRDGYSLEPFGNFTVPYGMEIIISNYGISHDEKYFENPWEFNPERSNGKNVRGEAMPFGGGARNCIGERLGLLVIKTAIINILKDFRIEMNDKTPQKLTIRRKAILLQYNEKLNVTLIKDPAVN